MSGIDRWSVFRLLYIANGQRNRSRMKVKFQSNFPANFEFLVLSECTWAVSDDSIRSLPSYKPQIATERSSEGLQHNLQQTEKLKNIHSDILRSLPSYEPIL